MNGKQLKNSILQWAIQGKLVPQNPKDEPASKLLERIAAQRVIASGAKQSKKNLASRLPAGRQCIYREGSSWFEESKDTQGLPAGRRDITEEIPFDIPESWEWCRLKDVFEMQAGKNVSAANIFPEPSEDHPYQCFGGNGIRGYVKNFNNDGEFPIVGRQGALCGNVNLAKGKFYATEHAVVVTLLGNLDLYWAYFFLIALNLNQYATATAQPGLAVSKIIETFIPLPPFTEQKRIAKKLEQILPLVDEYDQAQTQLDKLNKELPESLKKSILQQAIQGKLVPQNPKDEPAQKLLERIIASRNGCSINQGVILSEAQSAKSKNPAKKKSKNETSRIYRDTDGLWYEQIGSSEPVDISEEIPFEIPETWTWCRLRGVVSNRGQKTPTETFSYIDIGSIDNKKQKLNDKENLVDASKAPSRARKIVGLNDILYSTVRPYLHNMCIIDREFSAEPIASTGFAVMTCGEMLEYKYLFYYLLSPDFDSYANDGDNAKGVAYPAINDEKLYNALVPLPPLAEQKRIVAKLEQIFKYIEG